MEDAAMGANEDDLRWIYSQWDTEKLQQVLSTRRGDYTPAALSMMEEELKKRIGESGIEESDIQCPQCGLMNPATAEQCACGHSFSAQLPAPEEEVKKVQPSFRAFKANKKIADENLCGICKSPFGVGEMIHQCEKCLNFYHKKCWEESGGCNQTDCKEETQFCTSCGKEIKKSALKCRYCGAFVDETLRKKAEPKGPVKEATEALVYALIGLFICGIVFGPIAISKGSTALKKINEDPDRGGRGKATAGIVIGIIDIVFTIIFILISLARR
jgi:hypothetical protein